MVEEGQTGEDARAARTPTEPGSLSRRRFLGAIGGAVGGALAATALGGAGNALARTARASDSGTGTETVTQDKLGIIMWTCAGAYAADMPRTLELMAQIGYRYVEAPTLFPYGSVLQNPDAKAFRKALDDAGLWCASVRQVSPYPYNDKAWKRYVEDNLIIGTRYLGANITLPSTRNECLKYVDAVYKARQVAKRMGHKGSLYNHLEKASWSRLREVPSKYSVEYILERTTRDVWNVQLDTAHALGVLGSLAKVLRMVRKYPGRFPTLHMKDGFAPATMPDGSVPVVPPFNPTPFGAGDFGRPDPADPQNRPVAGFQDLLAAVRETTRWKRVLLIAEQDGTQATCFDYAVPFFQRMNGLRFKYRR